ncbi:MAG: hypothetical protein HYV07_25880 [Deltaproteobacteria bacterium]|nr:hypothetical protein [Deltaproteobacteria bacterium]
MTSEEPQPPSPRPPVLHLFLAAGVLFAVTFVIPHLPSRSPQLAAEFGLATPKGRASLELIDSEGKPVDGVVRPGQKLGVSYDGAGYVYLWLVELRASGAPAVILPRPGDPGLPWGMRARPGGERIDAVIEVAEGDQVFLALFSPTPLRQEELEAAIRATGESEPLRVAEALRVRGLKLVRSVHATRGAQVGL